MRAFTLAMTFLAASGCGRLGFEQPQGIFGVTLDANADAATDGPTLGFCAQVSPAPAFCEDYDGAEPSWTTQRVIGNGAIAQDEQASVTAPASRRITMAGRPPADPCEYAYEGRTLNAPVAATVRIEYQLLMGHLNDNAGIPQTDGANIQGITVSGTDGSNACDVYIQVNASLQIKLIIDPQTPRGSGVEFPLSRLLAPKQWAHVAIEVASTGRASAWINGQAAVTDAVMPSNCNFGLLQGVGNGLYCYGGDNDIEFRVDNQLATTR
jgi:hypothetical protein